MTTWRTSGYEGSGSIDAIAEGATSVSTNGGTATYIASSFRGSSAGRYHGQANLTTAAALPDRMYWRSWVRPVMAVDTNRLIVDFLNASATQASISVDTTQKWRIRNESGTTVATSLTSFSPNQWYGLEWWADRSLGQQQLKIYDNNATLLETLSGACGTLSFTSHREGILQGLATWDLDFDDSALADTVLTVTVATARSGHPKVWDGNAWVTKPAKVWNGTSWQPYDMKAWDGSTWKKSK